VCLCFLMISSCGLWVLGLVLILLCFLKYVVSVLCYFFGFIVEFVLVLSLLSCFYLLRVVSLIC